MGSNQLMQYQQQQRMMFGREEKKNVSYSFNIPIENTQPQRVNSFSADKLNSLRGQERVQERNIVERVLERLNSEGEVHWLLTSFEEKRNIPGFKGRIEWQSPLKTLKVVIKISFATAYFRFINSLTEGDIIIQLQELNFELALLEKKDLQQRIELIVTASIEAVRLRSFSDPAKKQTQCLRACLLDISSEMQKNGFENRRRVTSEKVDKKLNCKKYMLYPAPAAFSWNPLGSICITENKYPSNKRSFIGDGSAIRGYFQVSRNESSYSVLREETGELELGKDGHQPIQSIYDWKIEEEMDLLIFNLEQANRKEDKYYLSRSKDNLQAQTKREDQKKDEDNLILDYSRISSAKIRKIYERYYKSKERSSQFHRHDKLRVYDIRSFNRDYEDEIVYLLERIAISSKKTSMLQTVFQNDLSPYSSLLNGPTDPLRYQLLSMHIRSRISEPQLCFSLFLKLFILENEFLGGELQRYFKMLYRILGRKPHHQLYFLGSYNHFDHIRSEMLFMDLLGRFIEADSSSAGREMLLGSNRIRVRSKLRMPQIVFESVVSEVDKNNYLMKLFPVLIVKDREMEKFEFKQVKRIIAANSKFIKFVGRVNDIVAKFDDGRIPFLKQLVAEYSKFKEADNSEDIFGLQPRRFFLVHCSNCEKVTKLSELLPKTQMQFCQRCKTKLFDPL